MNEHRHHGESIDYLRAKFRRDLRQNPRRDFSMALRLVRNSSWFKNSSRFSSNSFPKIIRNGRNKTIYHVYDNRIASDDLTRLPGRLGVIRVLHIVWRTSVRATSALGFTPLS